MHFVPTLILWSIAWLVPVGFHGQHALGEELGANHERGVALIAAPLSLEAVDSSIAEASTLDDLGATPTEEDDFLEANALDCGPFPRWADWFQAAAVNHFPPPRDRADSIGRLFSLRC